MLWGQGEGIGVLWAVVREQGAGSGGRRTVSWGLWTVSCEL